METLYTFKEIQELTGLQIDFLRKIHKSNKAIFFPHTQRGGKNSLVFSSSSLVLFDVIKQRKELGNTIPEITEYLQKQGLQTNQTIKTDPPNKTESEQEKHNQNLVIEQLKSVYEVALQAKDQTISVQSSQIEDLRGSIRLLTDGRSPEEIRQEKEEQQRRLIQAETDAQRRLDEYQRHQDEANKELESVKKSEEQVKRQLQEVQEREQQALKRAELLETKASLLNELHKLPWYTFEKKKQLQKQIDDLPL